MNAVCCVGSSAHFALAAAGLTLLTCMDPKKALYNRFVQ